MERTPTGHSELLQPLLLYSKEGWQPQAHARFETSELHPDKAAIQNATLEANLLANPPRGLVLLGNLKDA